MPKTAVFIINYSCVGYAPLPNDINHPLVCESFKLPSSDSDVGGIGDKSGNQQKVLENDECTFNKSLCSEHGVNMITCICKSRPAKDLDLPTLKENCYFAITTTASLFSLRMSVCSRVKAWRFVVIACSRKAVHSRR